MWSLGTFQAALAASRGSEGRVSIGVELMDYGNTNFSFTGWDEEDFLNCVPIFASCGCVFLKSVCLFTSTLSNVLACS